MIKLPFFILSWVLFLLFRTVFILLGLILIPLMALFWRKTAVLNKSVINGRDILNWKYKFMFPWSNEEDGILAGDELVNAPAAVRIIYWTAIRNPANNLRFIKALSCQIDPNQVKFIGTHPKDHNGVKVPESQKELLIVYDRDEFTFISLTYCGLYSNLRVQFKLLGKIWRFWIGWKIYPHDSFGMAPNNYRRLGAGFATQFKKIYPRD